MFSACHLAGKCSARHFSDKNLSPQLTKTPNYRIHINTKIRKPQIATKPKTRRRNLCKFHLSISIFVALHVYRSKVDDDARSVSSDCERTFPTKRKWCAASTIHGTRQFLHLPKKSKLLIFAKKKRNRTTKIMRNPILGQKKSSTCNRLLAVNRMGIRTLLLKHKKM